MEADASDFETDDGGVGFQFFTFKNIVAFFTIFGWTGVTCVDYGLSTTLTLVISTFAGLIMMFLTSLLKKLIKQLYKINEQFIKETFWHTTSETLGE